MKNKNSKVPVAILSCFLIAFILQGILKLCGVLVFEKALDWQIFNLIDNNIYLQIALYSIFNIIAIYCLSFALTTRAYSKKWYHYLIILVSAVSMIVIRQFLVLTNGQHILIDILGFVVVPFIINLTTHKDDKLYGGKLFYVVTTISMNIMLYFCYLGITYWSTLLTSFIITNPVWLSASRNFLVHSELYLGLIVLMLSMNMIIKDIKRRTDMTLPMNISNDEAKVKAKKARVDKKLAKLQARTAKLQEKSSALAKQLEEIKKKDADQVKETIK